MDLTDIPQNHKEILKKIRLMPTKAQGGKILIDDDINYHLKRIYNHYKA